MDNRKLSRELAGLAKADGICNEWHNELLALDDKDAMVEMYLRGIDFCLSRDYPSNDFIRDNFKGMMERHGVFLDEEVSVSGLRKCVCLGACRGSVEIAGYNVMEVFVKHGSEITIRAKGNSFVMADVFDNARVTVTASDSAKVCVNVYGNARVETHAETPAIVKIREKNKRTY